MKVGFLCPFSQERIQFAAKAGFDCLEVIADPGSPLDLEAAADAELRRIHDECAGAGVDLDAVVITGNHLDADPSRRAAVNRYVERAISRCRLLGATIVSLNAWGDHAGGMDASLRAYREVFSRYAVVAEANGVRIAVENCPQLMGSPTAPGNSVRA